MLPGYRKKTKFVPTQRDSTGFVTLNNVVDTIKDMTSAEEFYEIEPAEVLKVHLDVTDSDFPTLTTDEGEVVANYGMMGSVTVRLLHSQNLGEFVEKLVRPISQHIVQYPLRGEIVNVAEYNGDLYYYNPLNLYGNVNMNRLPFRNGEGKVFPEFTKFNRKVYPQEGDTVVQGRYGQSIHFGSDKYFVKPYVKLSVGQSQDQPSLKLKDTLSGFPHLSEINLDEASIWVTTNGHVPLKTAAPSEMKSKHLGGRLSSVIAMNSDSIALNAKGLGNKDKKPASPGGDIHAFAARNINLAAQTSINLESEFGTVHIGAGMGVADNPIVKGKELSDFLISLVEKMETYIDSMGKAKTRNDIADASTTFMSEIEPVKNQLGEHASFFSRKVYVANDHNPPGLKQDEIDNKISKDGGEVVSSVDDVKWEAVRPGTPPYVDNDVQFDEG